MRQVKKLPHKAVAWWCILFFYFLSLINFTLYYINWRLCDGAGFELWMSMRQENTFSLRLGHHLIVFLVRRGNFVHICWKTGISVFIRKWGWLISINRNKKGSSVHFSKVSWEYNEVQGYSFPYAGQNKESSRFFL